MRRRGHERPGACETAEPKGHGSGPGPDRREGPGDAGIDRDGGAAPKRERWEKKVCNIAVELV